MTPRVDPTLRLRPSGRFALFDRTFMERYFRLRIARWFPEHRLQGFRILGVRSPLIFKQRAAYALTLLDPRGKKSQTTVRATVPSNDRTFEITIANRALKAVWQQASRGVALPTARPLAVDARLRAFFYEDVPGTPLESVLVERQPGTQAAVAASARWLARLHEHRLTGGRFRSENDEHRERVYFAFNYGRYYPPCHDPAIAMLETFFRVRRALRKPIRRATTLCHGDYNPGNVIISGTRVAGVIDFGNAIQYDPMSDFANAVLQFAILGWRTDIALRNWKEAQQSFFSAYRRERSPALSADRFYLFSLWWAMQTLSYILSIGLMKNKTPVIRALLRYGKSAEQLLSQKASRVRIP